MKILVIGIGSTGERHISNLMSLGYNNIILLRRKKKPMRTIKNIFPTYFNLENALNERPDIAFICNPTNEHVNTAIKCAQKNCHIFIEKPISNNLTGSKELKKIISKTKKVVMVGYMMRYHPCILKIKEWIDGNELGQIIGMRSTWGEYLPDWHKWEDYRNSYASIKSMGGGPALTLNHDIDIGIYLFGKIKSTFGQFNSRSNLEIDVEHYIDILIKFESGVTGNIHLDFVQKPPKRVLEVIGVKGRIEFDFYNGEAFFFNSTNNSIKKFKVSNSFNRNDLFIEEVRDFLRAITSNDKSPITLEEAYHSVKCSLDALSSQL